MQLYKCSKTSRKQIPAGFKKIDWIPGSINFDYGGGKYDLGSEFLATLDVLNLVFDPYNRSEAHNHLSMVIANNHATTSTSFNVLNVIKEKKWRRAAIASCRLDHTQTIYFGVYEGNRSGVAGRSHKKHDNWQNNRRLRSYLPEVRSVYPHAYMKGGLIIVDGLYDYSAKVI